DARGRGSRCGVRPTQGAFQRAADRRADRADRHLQHADARPLRAADRPGSTPRALIGRPSRGGGAPQGTHSITSSARAITDEGIVNPSVFAVLRLITRSYLVGACTGRSAGFSPFKIRST